MNENRITSARLAEVFTDARKHREVAEIIGKHSTNNLDVRSVALEGLDLTSCRTVLDLGCGFGFFTRYMKGRLHPDAVITGIDRCKAYRDFYLESCEIAGIKGNFNGFGVESLVKIPDNTYDLVICSYAMYFFPWAVPDIARILKPDGLFVTITHSVNHLSELVSYVRNTCLKYGHEIPDQLPYEELIRNFSDRNAMDLLAPYFWEINEHEYQSTLLFGNNDGKDFETYFRFKKDFYIADTTSKCDDVFEMVIRRLMKDFESGIPFRITKDDTIYSCRLPQYPAQKRKYRKRKFCPYCGGNIIEKMEGDVPREYCPNDELFFYDNPLPVVSAIVIKNREVLLVKRANEPSKGEWCLPTGFAEVGESIQDATLRELEEETGVTGEITGLVDADSAESNYYGDLIFLTFEVKQTGGELGASDDAEEVNYFPVDKTPPLAFQSNVKALDAFLKNKSEYWAIIDSFASTISRKFRLKTKPNMLSDKLVEVIIKNTDNIADKWIEDVKSNKSTPGYHDLPYEKLLKRFSEDAENYVSWLSGRYDSGKIRMYYCELGKTRRKEGYKLSELISALSLVRKNIWEAAVSQGMWQSPIDIYTTLELERRMMLFFDKVAYYVSRGFEDCDNE